MREAGHSKRCTGTTQRDGMGREVEGVHDGGTRVPAADAC